MADAVPQPESFLGQPPPPPPQPSHQRLSLARWRLLEPGLAPSVLPRLLTRTPSSEQTFWHTWLPRILWRGVTAPAVVLHRDPLVVGVYSRLFDTCALLRFPAWLAQSNGLSFESRLTAVLVNLAAAPLAGAEADRQAASDLHLGAAPSGYVNFLPVIADFVCEADAAALEQERKAIPEQQWVRAEQRGRDELWLSRGLLRDGRPSRAGVPAGADPQTYPVRDLVVWSFRPDGID